MGHCDRGRILRRLTLKDLLGLHLGPRSQGVHELFAHPICGLYPFQFRWTKLTIKAHLTFGSPSLQSAHLESKGSRKNPDTVQRRGVTRRHSAEIQSPHWACGDRGNTHITLLPKSPLQHFSYLLTDYLQASFDKLALGECAVIDVKIKGHWSIQHVNDWSEIPQSQSQSEIDGLNSLGFVDHVLFVGCARTMIKLCFCFFGRTLRLIALFIREGREKDQGIDSLFAQFAPPISPFRAWFFRPPDSESLEVCSKGWTVESSIAFSDRSICLHFNSGQITLSNSSPIEIRSSQTSRSGQPFTTQLSARWLEERPAIAEDFASWKEWGGWRTERIDTIYCKFRPRTYIFLWKTWTKRKDWGRQLLSERDSLVDGITQQWLLYFIQLIPKKENESADYIARRMTE
jgi:hypothetical protein